MCSPERNVEVLNGLSDADFLGAVRHVFENAPWVAQSVLSGRPYADIDALHAAMMQAVYATPLAQQVRFLQGHPDLAGKAARAHDMTDASIAEQAGAGLDQLSEAEYRRFDRANTAYRERFGFPFIVCVRNYSKAQILDEFDRRLANDRATEVARALSEVAAITQARLSDIADADDVGNESGSNA